MAKFDAIQPEADSSKRVKVARVKNKPQARKKTVEPSINNSSAPRSKNILWFYVSASMIVIIVVWLFVVSLNLQRISTGEQSLYDKIKYEITNVFRSDDDDQADTNLNANDLDDLEERVFPNININHSGTFTTNP